MFKKNSWIVALILALAVTALFIGCIDALPPAAEPEYDEVELGAFNAWGGQAYQKGWAVAGIAFDGLADKPEVAKDLGYKNDDFGNATRLVIEMPDDSYPKGNVDIIWGAEKADGVEVTRWRQTSNISSKKEDNKLTIDLTKMAGYADYKDPSITKRKLVIQAGGDDMSKLVVKAKLLIPIVEEVFVPLTDVSLKKSNAFMGKNFELIPVFTPEDASVKMVSWALYLDSSNTSGAEWISEGVVDPTVIPNVPGKSKTKLTTSSVGEFKVKATLRAAKLDAAGKYIDFTKDFTVTVTDPIPLTFTVGGVSKSTQEWAGVANSGETSDMVVTSGGVYTVDMSNGYGNCYHYFELDLGSEKLSDYAGVSFSYDALNAGAEGSKVIRVKASLSPPPEGYNPGLDIGYSAEADNTYGIELDGTTVTVKFGYRGVEGNTANSALAANVNTLSTQNTIYIWFLLWSGAAKYQISDINFFKTPIPYKVGATSKESVDYAIRDNAATGSTFTGVPGGFAVSWAGDNGNSNSWFRVDLGEAASNFTGVRFKLKGADEDGATTWTGTDGSVRVKVSETLPDTAYAPGSFAYLGLFPGSIATAQQVDAKFGQDERPGTAVNWTVAQQASSVLYFWIYFQPNGKKITYTVTDIEFYKTP